MSPMYSTAPRVDKQKGGAITSLMNRQGVRRTIQLMIICALMSSLLGCDKGRIETLRREDLFTLSLGRMEDQIDLFQVPGVPINRNNHIYLKAGRLYIANSNSLKIMEFTTYGDLVFLLYNAEANPLPIVLGSVDEGSDMTNRLAKSYPFRSLGYVVVDGKKNLYVEDEVRSEDRQIDENTGVVYYKGILKFDSQGDLIHVLGQEGIGGSPFPFIKDMSVTANDELVVVTRLLSDWVVFWFGSSGSLLYRIQIDPDNLPRTEADIPSVAKILSDPVRRELVIFLSYFREEIIETTQTRNAIRNRIERLYRYSLVEERYVEHIELPDRGTVREAVGATESRMPAPSHELLGIAGGICVFLRPMSIGAYELMIMNPAGAIVATRFLTLEDSDLYYKTYDLSEEGILVALLCFEEEAHVVWWRSDALAGRGDPKG